MTRFIPHSLIAIFLLLCVAGFSQSSGVSISNTNSSPDPSAMLDISSTDKGTLITRLTTVQRDAISNPAFGLLIFNTTTACFNMWNGNAWKQFCGECDFNNPLIGSNGPICEGETLSLTATSIPGATYQWSGPNGFYSTEQNPSIPNATSGASGSYSLIASLNGCSATPQTTVATVNVIPSIPSTGNNGPICVGQTLNLTSSSATGASFSWTGPNGFSAVAQNPSISNAAANQSGTYNVVATVNGCASDPGSTNVVINALPTSTFTPSTGLINTPITFSPTLTGATYSWAFTSGSPSISSSENPSVTWTSTGPFNVSLTVTQNGCSSTTTTPITINTPTVVTFNATGTGYNGSVQTWTIPATGNYTIEVWGAQGHSNNNDGGKGARMKGDFSLTAGNTLQMIVGQMGTTSSNCTACGCCNLTHGGGGGSFVAVGSSPATATPLIVAGGGGGAAYQASSVVHSVADATTNINGNDGQTSGGYGGLGGINGYGGRFNGESSSGSSGNGGGYYGDGFQLSPTNYLNSYGRSFINGGQGGNPYYTGGSPSVTDGQGGYGGGGGNGQWGGGGGGGYSGGGGGYSNDGCGGGGGSYNSGTNQSNSGGVNAGHGKITITY